mgnify:CR=1 FL=1
MRFDKLGERHQYSFADFIEMPIVKIFGILSEIRIIMPYNLQLYPTK